MTSVEETDIARLTRERDEAREALAEFLNEPCKDCLGYEAQMSGMEDAYRDSERGRRDAEARAERLAKLLSTLREEAYGLGLSHPHFANYYNVSGTTWQEINAALAEVGE